MSEDILKAVGGIIGLFIVISIMATLLPIIFNSLTETQCRQYIDQINQKNAQINGLTAEINQTNNLLNQCNDEYSELLIQNITKQDFNQIEGYFNLTQIQIKELNDKFDKLNTNYYTITNIVGNRYTISLSLNIVLMIELLSYALFKTELIMAAINFVKKKRKSKKEEDEQSLPPLPPIN